MSLVLASTTLDRSDLVPPLPRRGLPSTIQGGEDFEVVDGAVRGPDRRE